MRQQRLSAYLMQNFGMFGFKTSAFAGRHDGDGNARRLDWHLALCIRINITREPRAQEITDGQLKNIQPQRTRGTEEPNQNKTKSRPLEILNRDLAPFGSMLDAADEVSWISWPGIKGRGQRGQWHGGPRHLLPDNLPGRGTRPALRWPPDRQRSARRLPAHIWL